MSETGKLTGRSGERVEQPDPQAQAAKQDAAGREPGQAAWRAGLRAFASLPGWMIAMRDADRVAQALMALAPEFFQDGWELMDCDVGHIRYKNAAWSALYALTVRRPGSLADETIELQGRVFPPGAGQKNASAARARVVGRLGEPGWRADLPALDLFLETREDDSDLAALRFLTDPDESRIYLGSVLRAHLPHGQVLRLKTSSPKVVRYNRGSRCTVVYHLEYDETAGPSASSAGWPELVVAKTYHGEKGRNAFESMSALWNSPLGANPVVKIAQPLAYQPEHRVLVQGPIREEFTLEQLVIAAVETGTEESAVELSGYMSKTAAGLAALHNSGVTLGQAWTWQEQLDEVVEQIKRLAIVLPHLRAAAAPFLAHLDRLAAQIPADPSVPSHGTFRTPQVLICQGEIGFIDFDSFRQSEPADDLALFLGEMFNSGLMAQKSEDGKTRQPLNTPTLQQRFDYLMTVHDHFLDAYQQNHPVTRERVLLWEALDIFMFVLHTWTKVKLADVDSTFFLLERFLDVALGKGSGASEERG